MFAKLLLKKIELDFVAVQHAGVLNFWSQGISWNTKAMFYNTRNEKALGTKWFPAFPVVFFPKHTYFRFRNIVLC